MLAAACSFVLQSPALVVKREFFAEIVGQGNHPLTPLQVTNESVHEAKLAFRLVPPLLVHVLHLSVVEYYALQAVLGVATLAGVAWLLHRSGYTRAWAAALTGGLALTYMGSVWFVDTQPYFDAIAASALVLAFCVMDPVVVLLAGSVALWTDERAIPALGVVAVFHLYRGHRRGAIAAGIAFGGYLALRLYLGHHYGLSTGKADIGPSVLFDFWTGMPLPLLCALEGLWVLVGAAYWRAFRSQRWVVVVAGLLLGANAALAVMVNDVTRSTVYMLPGVLFGLVTLADLTDVEKRRLMRWPLVACLTPTVTAVVISGAVFKLSWVLRPLPLRLLF